MLDMYKFLPIIKKTDRDIYNQQIVYLGLRLCGGNRIGFEELAKEHFNSGVALDNWSSAVVSIFEWYWDWSDLVEERKNKHTKIVT